MTLKTEPLRKERLLLSETYLRWISVAFVVFFCVAIAFARKGAFVPLLFLLPFAFVLDGSKVKTLFSQPLFRAVAAFLVWLVISAAFIGQDYLSKAIEVIVIWGVGLGLCFLVSPPGSVLKEFFEKLLLYALTVLISFMFIEHIFGFAFYRNVLSWDEKKIIADVGAAIGPISLLTFCFAGIVYRRTKSPLWVGLVVLSCLVLSLMSPMAAAVVSLLVGLISFAFVVAFKRIGIMICQGGIALLIVIMPLLVSIGPDHDEFPVELPASWAHRVVIWKTVASNVDEAPLLGHGFRTSRSFNSEVMIDGVMKSSVPLHPHNASLQIWLELGAIGIALILIIWLALTRILLSLYQSHGVIAASIAQATLSSAALISFVSFGFWQTWWQSALAITAITLTFYFKTEGRAVE